MTRIPSPRSRHPLGAIAFVLCALSALSTACSTANQTVTPGGGELRFDAALPLRPAGASLCFTGDASVGATTWTALYTDYFGGAASCAGKGSCHADATGAGALESNYICPKGDKNACFTGLTSPGAALVNTADPASSGLYAILRKVNGDTAGGGNRMPKQPQCSFSEADMARISKWMSDGAKND